MSLSKKLAGFTLIELLLVLSLMSILTGVGIGVYNSFTTSSTLDGTIKNLVSINRKAILLSQSGYGGSAWSIHIDDDKIVLFRGSDYQNRDIAYDEVEILPSSIDVVESGTYEGIPIRSEITFSPISGIPTLPSAFVLTHTQLGLSQSLIINEQGTLTY